MVGTSRAENLNLTSSVYAKYDFNNPKDRNGSFSDFRKSTDLVHKKKKMVWYEKSIEKSELLEIGEVCTP